MSKNFGKEQISFQTSNGKQRRRQIKYKLYGKARVLLNWQKLLLGHIEVGQWLLTEDIGFDINNNYSRRAIEGVENKNEKIIHQRILFYKKHFLAYQLIASTIKLYDLKKKWQTSHL